ncbi:hypothetical protein D9M69_477690 [compost metagenome]
MTGHREAQHIHAVGQHLARVVDAVLFVIHLGHHHGAEAGADRASAIQLLGLQQRRRGNALGLQHRTFEQGNGDQAGTAEQGHFFVALPNDPSGLGDEEAACFRVASQQAEAGSEYSQPYLLLEFVVQHRVSQRIEIGEATRDVVALEGEGGFEQGELGCPVGSYRNGFQRRDPLLGLVRQQGQGAAPDTQQEQVRILQQHCQRHLVQPAQELPQVTDIAVQGLHPFEQLHHQVDVGALQGMANGFSHQPGLFEPVGGAPMQRLGIDVRMRQALAEELREQWMQAVPLVASGQIDRQKEQVARLDHGDQLRRVRRAGDVAGDLDIETAQDGYLIEKLEQLRRQIGNHIFV